MSESEWTVERFLVMLEGQTMLDLKGEHIGDRGVIALCEALLDLNKTVKIIDLTDNDFGIDGVIALTEVLKKNGTLIRLELSGNNIGPEGAVALAEALKINRKLTFLDLFRNNIGPQGALALSGALKINRILTHLFLSENNIGDEGAIALAEVLTINQTLTVLHISGNNMRAQGAIALAESLMINRTLTSLVLQFNDIRPRGAIALAQALKINGTLTRLELAENKIGREGAFAMAEALKINKTLRDLALDIRSDGVRALVEALMINQKIWFLGCNLRQYLDILSLPYEFSNKSNDDILSYLREVNSSQSQEIYRMRIMLVGPGSAGKSTLVHRILTEEFVSGQFTMTDGISMKEWRPPNPTLDDPPLHCSLWDFGGQEVYMNSHPMLFSDRTLYLLVWNPRSGTTLQTLEEYIRNIRSRSPSGPIMLVTTHCEEANSQTKEIQQSLMGLRNHNCLKHHAIDSRTGQGIEELKSNIIEFITHEVAEYSRVVVPGWYLLVESRLREEDKKKNRFSIDQGEFLSICSSVWPLVVTESNENTDGERMKTILELFHLWGVIYVLPNPTTGDRCGGDIVLNPQKLADVFKCVITCHTSQSANKQLFEEGILAHNRAGFVWPEDQYDPRLYSQFVCLFHHCELAFEVFDETGASSGCSVVPSLFPDSPPLTEEELRARLLNAWDSTSPSIAEVKSKNQIISRGFVKITFDSLLSNFFPKLMVRLHHLSSNSDCTRRRFVIRVPERVQATNGLGLEVGWSVCCVVEDKSSNSLIVYPGGCSYDATAIALQAIRRLMEGSFSGMCVEDVTFSAEEYLFSQKQILRLLRQNQLAVVPLDDGNNMKISLTFLSCLFVELDRKQSGPVTDLSSLDLSPRDLQVIFTLHSFVNQLSQPFSNPTALDLLHLTHSLVKAIPIFRHSGLKLSSHPSILWVCGQSSSAVHVVGVSPSVVPSQPWEIVWDSVISFPISSSQLSSESVLPLNELLLSSLRCLLLDHRLPDWVVSGSPIEWVGVVDCHSQEGLLASQGSQYFGSSRDILGEVVYYSQAMLTRQRAQGGLSADDLEKVVKEQVGPISEAVKKLREEVAGVRGGLEEIRQELLTMNNHEALSVLQDLWKMKWESLESLIRSSSSSSSTSVPCATEEQLAKEIKKEMRLMENSLTGKILELDLDEKFADRLSSEMRKLREVLLSANEDQLNELLEALKATM